MYHKPALAPSFGTLVLQTLFGSKHESRTATRVAQASDKPTTTVAEPVTENPDFADHLTRIVGRTGAIQSAMGGFHIHVNLAAAFPFALVLSALLRRNFRIDVVQRGAGLLIEARP